MKDEGLEDVDNLYTEDLYNYYYNKKPTHKIQYAATLNDPEKTEDLYENTETQTLATSKYISFEDACTYTVQVPVSEHWKPEVKVAKKAKVKNLQDYETFIEVKDEGQTKVGSHWVITDKELHDHQKTKVNA